MSSMTVRERESFDELRGAVRGQVVTPGEADWDQARRAWNLAVDQRPAAVVLPADESDVAEVLGFASARGYRVLAQGPGHLASPVPSLEGTILLRTHRLDAIDIDAAHATVRVGAGVTWASLTAALAEHGLMALAGSAPDVGVAGYLLGGGCSWFAREHGLACNSVLAVEAVTASGERRVIDGLSDPDLFWALRGGGGNFAIVTAMTVAAYRTPAVYAGMLAYPIQRAGEVWRAYAAWTGSLPESVTTAIRLLRVPPLPEIPDALRGQAFAVIDGAIDEPDDDARRLLEPLRALTPAIDTFSRIPVAALGGIHMDPPGPVPGVGDGMALEGLEDAVIDVLLRSAGPEAATQLLSVEVRHVGGAAARPVPAGGVVDRLPAQFLVYAVGIAPTPEAAAGVRAEIDGMLGQLEPWRAERDYSNFRESPAAASTFYSPDDLDRLRQIKRRIDPNGLIRSAHPLD